MTQFDPLTVTVTFNADDARLIEQARGIWTSEQFVKAATMNVAIPLVSRTTAKERSGAVPVLGHYEARVGCPCAGTPDQEDCPHA